MNLPKTGQLFCFGSLIKRQYYVTRNFDHGYVPKLDVPRPPSQKPRQRQKTLQKQRAMAWQGCSEWVPL